MESKDFQEIHDLALKAWIFTYTHINKKELKKLIDEYYSKDKLEKYLGNIKLKRQSFILAIENKKIIGFCNIEIKKNQGELLGLYIEPELIGKGFGKALLVKGEEFLKVNKIRKYFTFVNKYNKLGFNFYLRNNFTRLPEKDKDDEFEEKALWYIEKEL